MMPQSGGGFTFESGICRALFGESITQVQQLYLIGNEWPGYLPEAQRGTLLRFATTGKSHQDELEFLRLFESERLDMVVYLTPRWVTLEVPYLAVVWDLQHRRQPFFPELSSSPKGQWDSREDHYYKYLRRAAYVVTGTQTGRYELKLFYQLAEERIRVLPLPTPGDCLEVRSGIAAAEVPVRPPLKPGYLFYPAQFWPHKNHANLLLGLASLRERHGLTPDLVLTGSDKGNESYIRHLTSSLGLQSQVHFLGFVSRDEILALYKGALALVFPSLFGPDNLPPLEAMGLDCPVLTARVPGAEEQLGEAALYFDPLDADHIADKLNSILTDQILRNRLRERGLVRARSFTASDYGLGLGRILQEFASLRKTWPTNGPYTQLFSSEVDLRADANQSTEESLRKKEAQIQILSQAAEERLEAMSKMKGTMLDMESAMKQMATELVTQQAFVRSIRRHWWSVLGRKLKLGIN